MKKFTALLTAFALIISLCPVVGAAEKAPGTNNGNIAFLKNLGIVQTEEIDGTEALSRMELAKMYYSIMIGGDIPEYSPYATPFTDVTDKEAGYVKVVSDAGIMTGVASDRFGTAESVTYIQLIKTAVTFLGYTAHAEAAGGWPYGYYSVANSLGLTLNAPSDMNVYVTYNGAADVFRLAAEADLMIRSDYTEESYKPYEGNGYLEYYMGITLVDGIVTANSTMSLGYDDAAEFGKAKIGSETLAVAENALGVYDLIGQNVTVFVSSKSGREEVVYFEALENTVYEIAGDDIIDVDGNEVIYEKDGKEEDFKFDDYSSIIYNGSLAKNYTESTINPFSEKNLDGKITAIDNSGDKTVDVIMIDAYETFVCGGVRDMVATSEIPKGKSADFSEFGENSLAILNAIGEPISHTDIVAGDVLNCFYDLTGKLTKIVVIIDSGKGVIEEIKKDGDTIESLVISGNEFKCANSLAESPDYSKLSPGDSVTYWFNKDYKIGVIKKGIADSEFALTVDFKKDSSLGGGYMIKLMEATGKFSVYTLADKVDINGRKINAENVLSELGTVAENGKVVRQVIKYALNTEGKLGKIILADSSKDSSGNYATDFFVYDDFDGTVSKNYRSELYSFGLTYYVGSDSKIFVIPLEADRDNERAYAVKNNGYFSNGGYSLIAYGTDKYSPLIKAAIHVSSKGASANLDTASSLIAISKITNAFSEEGDEILRLDGFYSNSSSTGDMKSYEVESEEVLMVGKDGESVEPGDIVIISTDASGVVNSMKLVFDKSADSLYNMNNPSGSYPGADQRFIYGELVCTDGTYITVELTDTDGTIRRESYPISRFTSNGAVCTEDERTGKLTYADAKSTDMYDRESYGENCSKVFVFVKGPWWLTGIIYN